MEDEQQSEITRALEGAEAVAEMIAATGMPGVSFVAWALGRAAQSRRSRQEALIAAMATRVDQIADRMDADFVNSEEFEALTEEVLEKGAHRRELDKREYYAALFANSTLPDRPDEAARFRYIDTLERLREPQLWLLHALLTTHVLRSGPDTLPSSFKAEFEKAVSSRDLSGLRDDWRDLETLGLVGPFPSTALSGTAAGNFRSHVTDLGLRFHQFVVLPYGDVHPPA